MGFGLSLVIYMQGSGEGVGKWGVCRLGLGTVDDSFGHGGYAVFIYDFRMPNCKNVLFSPSPQPLSQRERGSFVELSTRPRCVIRFLWALFVGLRAAR